MKLTPKKKLSKKEKIMMLQPVRSGVPSPSASSVASPTTTTPKNKLPSPSPKKNLARRQQQPDRLAAPPKPSFTKRETSVAISSSSTSNKRYNELCHKITYLSGMILGFDLITVLLLSSGLTYGVYWIGEQKYKWILLSYLTSSSSAVGTLGALFSFALVFRTNICYARWWEGRTLWGNIIVNSIRICQQSRLWIHDDQLNDRVDCLAITFAYACKAQLRGNRINDEEEDGRELVQKGILAQEELDVITNSASWQPYYCIDALRATINEGLVRTEHDISYEGRKNAAHTAMEETIANLAGSMGGCIRVRSTGLPVAYDNILNAIGVVFFTAATLAWAPGAKYYNPLLILLIYTAVKMIVGVGNDMEEPFGLDESDLPLESFCNTIELQINAIEERRHVVGYDLAYGPKTQDGVYSVSLTRQSSNLDSSFTSSSAGNSRDPELGIIAETSYLVPKSYQNV